jgi:hypothetical protein
MESTRSKQKVYLLSSFTDVLKGTKLPSLRQVLGLFLHEHTILRKTVREASSIAIEKTLEFWHKARIPVREARNCRTKLEKEFEEWRLLKKNAARTSATQQANETAFSSKLDDLFDGAHADAIQMMTIPEDRDFLLAQQEKGRRGSMAGIDVNLLKKEKRASQSRKQKEARRERAEISHEMVTAEAELASSSSSMSSLEDSDEESRGATDVEGIHTPSCLKRKRLIPIMTPALTAMLDRTKVTDRKAVFIVAETAKSLGHDIQDLALSRSSIRRQRQDHRALISARLKAEFQAEGPLVVHWDGKLLRDLIGRETIDRLPILVSGRGVAQLLRVAKLPSSTGLAQANVVCAALQEWGVANRVCAMSFDTTSSNTGMKSGACILIEEMLGGVDLLWLACRHYIFELIIGAVFQVCMGYSSAPDVLMFKRFQSRWQLLDKSIFETGQDRQTSLFISVYDIQV